MILREEKWGSCFDRWMIVTGNPRVKHHDTGVCLGLSFFFHVPSFLQRNFLWHILRHDDGYNPRWAGMIICQSLRIQKQIFTKFYKFWIYLRLCDLSFLTSPLCHPVMLLKTPAFGWINNPRQIGGLTPISHNELLWSLKAGLDISFEALRLFSAHNDKTLPQVVYSSKYKTMLLLICWSHFPRKPATTRSLMSSSSIRKRSEIKGLMCWQLWKGFRGDVRLCACWWVNNHKCSLCGVLCARFQSQSLLYPD